MDLFSMINILEVQGQKHLLFCRDKRKNQVQLLLPTTENAQTMTSDSPLNTQVLGTPIPTAATTYTKKPLKEEQKRAIEEYKKKKAEKMKKYDFQGMPTEPVTHQIHYNLLPGRYVFRMFLDLDIKEMDFTVTQRVNDEETVIQLKCPNKGSKMYEGEFEVMPEAARDFRRLFGAIFEDSVGKQHSAVILEIEIRSCIIKVKKEDIVVNPFSKNFLMNKVVKLPCPTSNYSVQIWEDFLLYNNSESLESISSREERDVELKEPGVYTLIFTEEQVLQRKKQQRPTLQANVIVTQVEGMSQEPKASDRFSFSGSTFVVTTPYIFGPDEKEIPNPTKYSLLQPLAAASSNNLLQITTSNHRDDLSDSVNQSLNMLRRKLTICVSDNADNVFKYYILKKDIIPFLRRWEKMTYTSIFKDFNSMNESKSTRFSTPPLEDMMRVLNNLKYEYESGRILFIDNESINATLEVIQSVISLKALWEQIGQKLHEKRSMAPALSPEYKEWLADYKNVIETAKEHSAEFSKKVKPYEEHYAECEKKFKEYNLVYMMKELTNDPREILQFLKANYALLTSKQVKDLYATYHAAQRAQAKKHLHDDLSEGVAETSDTDSDSNEEDEESETENKFLPKVYAHLSDVFVDEHIFEDIEEHEFLPFFKLATKHILVFMRLIQHPGPYPLLPNTAVAQYSRYTPEELKEFSFERLLRAQLCVLVNKLLSSRMKKSNAYKHPWDIIKLVFNDNSTLSHSVREITQTAVSNDEKITLFILGALNIKHLGDAIKRIIDYEALNKLYEPGAMILDSLIPNKISHYIYNFIDVVGWPENLKL